ncbi:MAG: glycosyl hydrolase family 8 [Limimaricola soesokkakensis]|uniref:glycosyl hydrolase family 8 n=1 Tax=Limimaricola soesokkakensis TaxID=1343159 RepID=UPI0040593A93
MISRRSLITLLAGGAVAAVGAVQLGASEGLGTTASPDPLRPLWDAWKAAHLAPEGRVVDAFQDDASHSEGQGYGLVLAETFGDLESFERILDWSIANLSRPGDNLLSWLWKPADGGKVIDANNATDGDIFHAWALVRAAERFGRPAYLDQARGIATDIARHCVRDWPGRPGQTVLLPGEQGFEKPEGLIVNPAYICPRALSQLGRTCRVPELETVAADGVALLTQLSRDALPPDWVMLGETGPQPVPGKSSHFGYEALRLPLYLVWSGLSGHPAVQRAAAAYAPFIGTHTQATPTVIAPRTGEIIETSSDTGYRAIAVLAACGNGPLGPSQMPAFSARQPYYPSTLHLLALVAQKEASFSCYSL